MLLARAGILGLDSRGLSPDAEPIGDTRLAMGTELPVMRLILRGFFIEFMTLRSLRTSIVPDSESEPDAVGGLFSSEMICNEVC